MLCNHDSQLAGNIGKKNLRFPGGMVAGLPSGDTHIDFEMINALFYDGPDFIKENPFIGIPLDTGKYMRNLCFRK